MYDKSFNVPTLSAARPSLSAVLAFAAFAAAVVFATAAFAAANELIYIFYTD